MKVTNIKQNTPEWEDARKGKVTGTSLKDLTFKRGGKNRAGFYRIIAERLKTETGDEPLGENSMERGNRLEDPALDKFEEEKGVTLERDLFIMDENDERVAFSPDAMFMDDESQMAEVKCLSSHRHIQAYLEQKIPKKYHYQKLMYFIVNDDLETLHFTFYDPSIPALPFFVIEVKREQLQEEIDEMKEMMNSRLDEIDEIVNNIMFS